MTNVLLVEDKEADARVISHYLGYGNKYNVIWKSTLEETRHYLNEETPDIALVDYTLEDDKSGLGLLDDYTPHEIPFPFILLTASTDKDIAEEALKKGALDYIRKSQESFEDISWIVERALREWQLRQENEALKERTAIIDKGTCRTDAQGNLTYLDRDFSRLLGYKSSDIKGKSFLEIVAPEFQGTANTMILRSRDIQLDSRELQLLHKDKSPIWVNLETRAKDTTIEITVVNISTKKQNEEYIRQIQEERLIDIIPALVWMSDAEGKVTFLNQSWVDFTGQDLKEAQQSDWLERVHPEDRDNCRQKLRLALESKEGFEIEYRFQDASAEFKWLLNKGKSRYSPDGSFSGFIGSCFDISERKMAEEKAKILLAETHHRVKNNLNLIDSLLSLQARYSADPKIIDIFSDNRSRIKSMALLFEQLYSASAVDIVAMPQYIINIIDCISEVFKSSKTNFVSDIESINLHIETAIPVGLMINELVTNSLKHAFTELAEDSEEEIRISFTCPKKNKYRLIVSDNGKGIPPDIDWKDNSSFGLRIIRLLAQQLSGEIDRIEQVNGTGFSIIFSELSYKNND
jgi:PAS domain S-box-containing protein